MDANQSGIYAIVNTVNKKVYIGQSKCIRKRWQKHIWRLDKNTHGNKHLQQSWNLYGKSSFQFKVICNCAYDNLDDLEMKYIREYKSYDDEHGYNLTYGDENNNIVISDSTREKLKLSHSYSFIQINKYSVNGCWICKYDCMQDAAKDVHGTCSGIRNCANAFRSGGYAKTYKGFVWVYNDDCEKATQQYILEYLKHKPIFGVYKYEYPSGKYICDYDSISSAALDNDVSVDVISMCIRGVQRQSNGYTYRKSNSTEIGKNIFIPIIQTKSKNAKPIIALYKDTNQIYKEYESISLCKDDGFSPAHVTECCKGKRKTCGGFIWKYKNEEITN